MEQWELVAREHIRQLVADYTHFGDQGRIDEMTLLFEPEAVVDAHGHSYIGRDEIAGFFGGIASEPKWTGRTFMRHHISNVSIQFDNPNEATGASYWTVFADEGFESSGRYRDGYRQQVDGTWRFATRKIRRDEPRA